ncbi:UNVERIFIED_CONTAM: hypothetical protein K2H54_053931 [Gekko kuhli]
MVKTETAAAPWPGVGEGARPRPGFLLTPLKAGAGEEKLSLQVWLPSPAVSACLWTERYRIAKQKGKHCQPAREGSESIPEWNTDQADMGVDEKDEGMPFEESPYDPCAPDPNEELMPPWILEPIVSDEIAPRPNEALPLKLAVLVEPPSGDEMPEDESEDLRFDSVQLQRMAKALNFDVMPTN